MENSPKFSKDIEKAKNKIPSWVKRLAGAGIIVGGVAFGVDQVWDSYQETQKHKDREENKKKNIELADETLHSNVFILQDEFKDKTGVPDLDKSVDSLSDILQSLEDQKKKGVVEYETLVKVRDLTESIKHTIDSSNQGIELLPTINLIKENVREISNAEMSRELSGHIGGLLNILNDKEVLEVISKHPSATKRILESIERYKDVFSDYYVDPNIIKDGKITSLVDSLHINANGENRRIVYTLVKMQQDGVLNDFFETLGRKINTVLIAQRFENRISLSKNLLEVMRDENFKKLKDDPSILMDLEKEMQRSVTEEEASDVAIVSHIFYSSAAHDFFAIFSKDNTEEVEEFIKSMTNNRELSDNQKEEITNLIREFGKKIQDFIVKLEESEK